MIIVSLWSVCYTSRVRRVTKLPADIHKAAILSILSTRCAKTNSEFNTYFVTSGLLVGKEDPNPSCLKERLMPKSDVRKSGKV